MDLSRPATTLLKPLDAEVLGVLFRSERSLTVREIHRLTEAGSFEGVRLALLRLADTGMLRADRRTAGTFYEVNRRHLAYPAVEILLSMRTGLIEAIGRTAERWKAVALHVSVFGSFARQDGDTTSDIDVVVVLDDDIYEDEAAWADNIAHLETAIHEWTGNRAAVLTMGLQEVRSMALGKRASRLWKSLREESVVAFGPRLPDLIRARQA